MNLAKTAALKIVLGSIALISFGCSTNQNVGMDKSHPEIMAGTCNNLIMNGDFELNGLTIDVALTSDNVGQTKWTPAVGGILIKKDHGFSPAIANYIADTGYPNNQQDCYRPPSGSHFAYLQYISVPKTDPDTNQIYQGASSISQPIGTKPLAEGCTYQLSFCQAAYTNNENARIEGTLKGYVRVEVAPNSNQGSPIFSANFEVPAASGYVQQTALIPIAETGLYTIKFIGYHGNPNDRDLPNPTIIDNIVFCEKPILQSKCTTRPAP